VLMVRDRSDLDESDELVDRPCESFVVVHLSPDSVWPLVGGRYGDC
jgi:hypothetical protein